MTVISHLGVLLGAGLLLAAPARGQDMPLPGTQAQGRHYALQTCIWPERYRRCMDKCDWKKRRYEESGDCVIDPYPDGTSTCREREVRTVRACQTQCEADFCPQYNP